MTKKSKAGKAGDGHPLANLQFHAMAVQELTTLLEVPSLHKGLPANEAALGERRLKYGANLIETGKGVEVWRLLFSNFVNPMSGILSIVAVISAIHADWIEFGVVIAVIFINGILGFYQEYGSEKAMAALQRLTAGTAHVVRSGHVVEIPIDQVVVGDVCVLEHGQQVPADIRLFEANHLQIDEALLTGESLPVHKHTDTLEGSGNIPLGDQKNLCFRQTAVVMGRGRGIVYAVGMQTQIGRLARILRERSEVVSPLQQRLNKMMYVLLVLAIVLAGVVFAVNRSFDESTTLYASALGVAILPESLLVTITVSMTVGVRRMARHKTIVRKLAALEVLSALTDVCSDKTGTLTEGKMVAVRLVVGTGSVKPQLSSGEIAPHSPGADSDPVSPCPNHHRTEKLRYQIAGPPLSKFGDVYIDSSHVQRDPIDISLERLRHPSLELMLHAMSLCSNASVVQINEDGDLEPTGSPTEVALQVLCCKAKIWRSDLEANGWTRRGEWAFDSGVKMMSVGYLAPDGAGVIFLKGAPERLLARCTHFLEETQEGTQSSVGGVAANAVELVPMNANMRNHVLASVGRLASKGLRVLALGYRSCEDIRQCDIQDLDREYVESNVVYVGLVGVFDPPRAESAPAVELCKRAGIRVRMLTGDIQETAKSIAQTLGILTPQHSLSLNGPEFDQLSNAELDKMSDLPRCISRCSPDTKVSVVKALQRRKLVVLMTGDGVNDAPALKMANVGVAMGSGSDVTKGAADIVVTNDSFASIVKAIAEGRRIFNSLKQFTFHLLSANVAQVLSLVIGLVFMDDNERSVFILSPLAILFVNTMSGLATMGLAFDKADPDVMHRPPNTEGLFTKELLSDIFVTGFIMGALTLSNFVIVMYGVGDGNLHTGCNYYSATCSTVAEARATAFATMHILLLFQAYVVRSGRRSVFAQHFFDNRFLWLAVTCGILAIFPIIYIPVVAQDVFHQKAISWEWGLILGALVLYLLATEIYTLIKNLYFPEERPVVDQNVQDGRRELAISDAEDEDQFEMIRQEMLPPSVSVQLNLHAIARGQRQLASTPAPEHASRITRAHSSHLVTVSFPAAGDVPSTQTLTEVQGLPSDDPHASPENAV